MRRTRTRSWLTLFLCLIGLLLPTAFSDWSYFQNIEQTKDVTSTPIVCYVNNANYGFPTIESAFESIKENNKSDDIYIIPGSNASSRNIVHLNKDITIESGDRLILPYSLTISNTNDISAVYDCGKSFTSGLKNEFASYEDYCVLDLKVKTGVKITIGGGELIIGGYTGNDGQGLISQTSLQFCQITLAENSEIVSNNNSSKLNLKGYIRRDRPENSTAKLTMEKGSATIPFVCYDFKGGTASGSIALRKTTFPLSVFDFPNLEVLTIFKYGSYAIGEIKVAAASQQYITYPGIIGTSSSTSLFMLQEGASLELDFTPETYRTPVPLFIGTATNTDDNTKTNINIYGNANLQDIELSLAGYGINSADYFVPLSYRLNIKVMSGANLTIPIKIKCMPGFELLVYEGAQLNITGDVVIYSGYTHANVTYGYPFENFPEGAIVYSNGRVTIPATANVYGKINVSATGARLIYNSTNTSNISIKEFVSSNGLFNEITSYTITESPAYGNILVGGSIVEDSAFVSGNTYVSKNNESNVYYWEKYEDITYQITNISLSHTNMTLDCTETEATVTVNSVTTVPANSAYTLTYTIYKNNVKWKTLEDTTQTSYTVKFEELNKESNVYEVQVKATIVNDPTVSLTSTCSITHSVPSITRVTINGEDEKNYDATEISLEAVTSTLPATGVTLSYQWRSHTSTELNPYNNIAGATNSSYSHPLVANDGDVKYYYFSVAVTLTYNGDIWATEFSEVFTVTHKKKPSGSCLLGATEIMLASGETKQAKDIKEGDELLVVNHETGELDTSKVLFNDVEKVDWYDITFLNFSDGTEIGISYEHGFFDKTLNKYVYITNSNANDFVGHVFQTIDGETTLTSTRTVKEFVELYSPVTEWHLNYFSNGLLSMPGGIEGLFNIFEYEEDSLKYDEALMQQDIETYGLFTYEDFKEYISYEFYSVFPAPYLKVSIGKGYITMEEIQRLINRYSKYF